MKGDLLIQTDYGFFQFEIKVSKTIKEGAADGMIEAVKSILPAEKLQNSTLITYNDTKMPFKGGVEYGGLKSLIEIIKTIGGRSKKPFVKKNYKIKNNM